MVRLAVAIIVGVALLCSAQPAIGGEIHRAIEAGDVKGELGLRTAGGDIEAGDVEGDAGLKTAGGDIEIGTVGKDLDAKTAGGDITVGDVGGYADVSTAHITKEDRDKLHEWALEEVHGGTAPITVFREGMRLAGQLPPKQRTISGTRNCSSYK